MTITKRKYSEKVTDGNQFASYEATRTKWQNYGILLSQHESVMYLRELHSCTH